MDFVMPSPGMGIILGLASLGYLAAFAWFVYDIIRRRDIANLPKTLWILAIVFLGLIGMILYWALKPQNRNK